jgi:hypothetical protein
MGLFLFILKYNLYSEIQANLTGIISCDLEEEFINLKQVAFFVSLVRSDTSGFGRIGRTGIVMSG